METSEILENLISISSQTSESNKAVVSYIQHYYKNTKKFEYKTNGNIQSYNLLISLRGRERGSLVFACHTDTIDIQSGWKTNPLVPVKKNGKIYGLGSSDMKGSIACIINATKKCNPLKDVYLIFTGSEEDNSQGTRSLIDQISLPSSDIIIPEPTCRTIYTRQRGYLNGIVGTTEIERRFNPEDKNFDEEKENILTKMGKIVFSNPPYSLSKKSSLARRIASLDTKINLAEEPFKGWTEAALFKKFGDAIIFGAGDYAQCHKPNESIVTEDLLYFTELFNRIINYKN